MTVADMAVEIGVSRATIHRWFADDDAPVRAAYIRTWADVTHVPARWLEHGVIDPTPTGGGNVLTVAYGGPALFKRPAGAPFQHMRAQTPLFLRVAA